MRHFLLPLPVALRSPRVREAARPRPLVSTPGPPNTFAPRLLAARSTAVALAAVAAAAHEHVVAPTCTDKCPCAACAVVALPCTVHARLAALRARVPWPIPAVWTTLSPGAILCAHSRPTRVGARRFKQLAWSSRSLRPVLCALLALLLPPELSQHPIGGAGGLPSPPVQAVVHHFSQRQRSVHASNDARGIQPPARQGRWLRAFKAFGFPTSLGQLP
jgi:hypothetical protein